MEKQFLQVSIFLVDIYTYYKHTLRTVAISRGVFAPEKPSSAGVEADKNIHGGGNEKESEHGVVSLDQ